MCRLESKLSKKDSELLRAKEIEGKNKEENEILNFIKYLNTQGICNKKNTSHNIFNSYRAEGECNKREAEEVSGPSKSRKRKRMNCSTPGPWRQHREMSPERVLGITPIRALPPSPDTVNPEAYLEEDSQEDNVTDKGRTELSNELRGKVITPRRQETSEDENRSLAKETLMLERSTTRTGADAGGKNHMIQVDPLAENSFFNRHPYPRERSKSLDSLMGDLDLEQLENWSRDSFSQQHSPQPGAMFNSEIVLGVGADKELLEAPATPGTPGATKRCLSPHKRTPRGRPRKFSTAQMECTGARINLVTILPDKSEDTSQIVPEVGVKDSVSAANSKDLTGMKYCKTPPKKEEMKVEGQLLRRRIIRLNFGGAESIKTPARGGKYTASDLGTPRNDRVPLRHSLTSPRRGRKSSGHVPKNQPKISYVLKQVAGMKPI